MKYKSNYIYYGIYRIICERTSIFEKQRWQFKFELIFLIRFQRKKTLTAYDISYTWYNNLNEQKQTFESV